MNFTGKLTYFDIDNNKVKLIIETDEIDKIYKNYEFFKNKRKMDIQIKQHDLIRTLDANSYMWYLINKIANITRCSKEEVYLEMIKRYGQSDLVRILSFIDVSKHFKYYKEAGTKNINGEDYTYYIVYRGSSEYTKKEMAILIDGIISECEELGIVI